MPEKQLIKTLVDKFSAYRADCEKAIEPLKQKLADLKTLGMAERAAGAWSIAKDTRNGFEAGQIKLEISTRALRHIDEGSALMARFQRAISSHGFPRTKRLD